MDDKARVHVCCHDRIIAVKFDIFMMVLYWKARDLAINSVSSSTVLNSSTMPRTAIAILWTF